MGSRISSVALCLVPFMTFAGCAPEASDEHLSGNAAGALSFGDGASAIRIEAGGGASFTDMAGNAWEGDRGFTGGQSVDRGSPAISNSQDARIYQTERYGMSGYSFSMPNGNYNVKLHFAETYAGITGPDQRVFDVTVEQTSISDLDVFREAGGRNIALVKSVDVIITDGELNIGFVAKKNNAMIAGIEIALGPSTPERPLGTVVAQHGQLQVSHGQLLNQFGTPIQLKGMSSHGLQWFGNLVNAGSLQWMRDDWGASVFRAAMYTSEGGYVQNRWVKDKVKEAVDAAIKLGIYVIVDWHILRDSNPHTYKQQAKEFFAEISSLYGKFPNVIYEICNEPNGDATWSGTIKPYADEVIPVIRANDPDNVIIVGTPNWSSDLLSASYNPLNHSNTMYTLHFYSGRDGQGQRNNVDTFMKKGLAVFVTEWGTSSDSGDGGPFLDEAARWLDFLQSRKISWANWSLSTKNESSAALNPSANPTGPWTDANLSSSGRFVRTRMRSPNH